MDYDDTKLGLIGRLRVWNEKRKAYSQRQQYNKDENEYTEVDYSEANKLSNEKKLKRHKFMEQYPTKKSAEELEYEKKNTKPDIFIKIGDKDHKVPFGFRDWCLNNGFQYNINFPLEKREGNNLTLQVEKMAPEDRYTTTCILIKNMLDTMSSYIEMADEPTSPDSPFSILCSKVSFFEYVAKQLKEAGKTNEAIGKLELMAEETFKQYEGKINQGKFER